MSSNGGARHGARNGAGEPTSFVLQPPGRPAAVPHPGNPYGGAHGFVGSPEYIIDKT
ncbi:hypothetical protein ABTX62_21800 [Streptomyces sp. NPDC096046]|uniref:hypothetical protein n=1 Tax=Streptomyces sp. NPDC096046 TaxID=3155542 RepID=UPI00331CA733